MRGPIILAALSALLLGASFPPVNLTPLSWVALVPLFFSLDNVRSQASIGEHRAGRFALFKRTFFIGWLFGFFFFLATVYWVVYSMYVYGGVPLVLSIFFMLLLVSILALYPALFALTWRWTKDFGVLSRLFLVPSAWVGLEYLRGLLFTGFPWAFTGYTQARFNPLIQIADIFGVYGLSFLVVLVNLAIYGFLFKKEEGAAFFGLERRLAAVLVALALLTSTLAYGFIKIDLLEKSFLDWKPMKVGVAQGNVDQSIKWDKNFRLKTIEIYSELTRDTASEGAELIVWPESAVPFYLFYDNKLGGLVRGVARNSQTYLLTGSPHFRDNEPGSLEWTDYYNSAFLIDPAGNIKGRYDKVKLVPFGEYVPMKKALFFIKKLTEGYADFTPGGGHRPIDMDGVGIGILICFESIFPDISSATVRNGAKMLVILTNDGWFGKTSAAYQHFDMAILRAVENRVYLVRAANRGISGVVDPLGRVIEETGLLTRESFVAELRTKDGDGAGRQTIFTLYGRFFPIVLIFFSVFAIAIKFKFRR